MHEFHIVEALVKKTLKEAEREKVSGFMRLTIAIGEHSGLEEGAVRLYWEDLAKGTVLENAELVFRKISSRLHCRKCGADFDRKGSALDCPECGLQGVPTGIGKEFYVEKMEIK